MADSKRNLTIDVMKGFLIALVVIGHSHWEFGKIIYWFHMPVFFMISGYLLKVPEKSSEKKWLLRKIKSLLIPYAVYSLICSLFQAGNGIKAVAVCFAKTLYGGELAGGVYWFITVLLLSEIAVVLIENRIHKPIPKYLIYLSMYVIAIVESVILIPANTITVPFYTKLPWNIDVCLFAVPFLIIGYTLKLHSDWIFSKLKTKLGIVLIITGTAVLGTALYFSGAYEWFRLDMKYSQYKNPVLDLLCPIFAGAFIWLVSYLLSKTKIGVVIGYVGKNSLPIMYLHIIIRDYLLKGIFGENYPIILFLIISIAISLLFAFIVSKLPKISFVFGVKPSAALHN